MACLCMVFCFVLSTPSSGYSADGVTNTISNVESVYDNNSLKIRLQGSDVPIFTAYELFNPARLVVDLANSKIGEGVPLAMPAESGIILSSKKINSISPVITRFVFTLDESRTFSVVEDGNDLLITIDSTGRQKKAVTEVVAGQEDAIAALISDKIIANQLPEIDPLQPVFPGEGVDITGFMQDGFAFGGYKKERISVDFFKIDLHNVFRLLREVSGKNIVVDEAVSGSLTLALNDVPWDFALDIILNLKGLQKEERFNTIVILPGGKEFFWPERAEDNLTFEPDLQVVAQEALLIQRQENIPLAVVEARELINKGRVFEKQENYEKAVQIYEAALRKWPDNARLAGRISSIYLVQLRHNVNALFFARKVLAIEPESSIGLLNGAIASANMRDFVQAKQYFDKAVMGMNPSKEALLNYAVFSEEQQYYEQAIKLLRKHDSIHGEDLHSMLAIARVLEKQGREEEARIAYRRILLSGYRISPGLRSFIEAKIAMESPMYR